MTSTVRWRWLVRLVVLGMIALGVADDLVDFDHQDPYTPDRLITTSFDTFVAWQIGHPGLERLFALGDVGTSLLLSFAGVALLLGVRTQPAFAPASFAVGLAVLDGPNLVSIPTPLLDAYYQAYWWLLLVALARISVQFPTPLTPSILSKPKRSEASKLRGVGRKVQLTFDAAVLRPRVAWMLVLGATVATAATTALQATSGPVRHLAAPLSLTLVAGLVVLPVQTIRYFVIGYQEADSEARRQALWFVQAVVVYLTGFVLVGVFAIVAVAMSMTKHPLFVVGVPAFYLAVVLAAAVFLLVSVFYDGIVNPALVLRRTVLLSALTGIGALLLAGVHATLSSGLAKLIHVDDPVFSGMITTFILTATLIPIRTKISNALDPLYLAATRSLNVEYFLVQIGTSSPMKTIPQGEAARSEANHIIHLRRAAAKVARYHGGARMQPTGDGVVIAFYDSMSVLRTVDTLNATRAEIGMEYRIAIHYGPVILGTRRDLSGTAVADLASLYSTTQGGVVVASDAALDQAPDELPDLIGRRQDENGRTEDLVDATSS